MKYIVLAMILTGCAQLPDGVAMDDAESERRALKAAARCGLSRNYAG